MDGLEMLYTRRSVRSFTDKQISDDILKQIVRAGRLAASAINHQPIHIVIVKNEELIKNLAQTTDYGKFIEQAPVCLVLVSEDTKYYLEDGSACAQNILLAACYFGIGSCWVAGDKKKYAEKIVKMLKMPDSCKLICLIPLGYPQNADCFKQKALKSGRVKIVE